MNYIDLNRWYNIIIEQKLEAGKVIKSKDISHIKIHYLCQVYYTIVIDEQEVYRAENTDPRTFRDVKVFASDNFHPAADARYKNLVWEQQDQGKLETFTNLRNIKYHSEKQILFYLSRHCLFLHLKSIDVYQSYYLVILFRFLSHCWETHWFILFCLFQLPTVLSRYPSTPMRMRFAVVNATSNSARMSGLTPKFSLPSLSVKSSIYLETTH